MKNLKSFLKTLAPMIISISFAWVWIILGEFAIDYYGIGYLFDGDYQFSLVEEGILLVSAFGGFSLACSWSALVAFAKIVFPYLVKLFPKRKRPGGADNG